MDTIPLLGITEIQILQEDGCFSEDVCFLLSSQDRRISERPVEREGFKSLEHPFAFNFQNRFNKFYKVFVSKADC